MPGAFEFKVTVPRTRSAVKIHGAAQFIAMDFDRIKEISAIQGMSWCYLFRGVSLGFFAVVQRRAKPTAKECRPPRRPSRRFVGRIQEFFVADIDLEIYESGSRVL